MIVRRDPVTKAANVTMRLQYCIDRAKVSTLQLHTSQKAIVPVKIAVFKTVDADHIS